MQQTKQEQVERVSIEDEEFSVEVDATATVVADGLQERLHDVADEFDVTGFKCVKCDLAHMHGTTKHRLSDSFDVDESVAVDAEYNPVCHCGLQEAGRHGAELGIDEGAAAQAATSAPIPPEASRKMNEQFGAL